jgi:hypothetical protein
MFYKIYLQKCRKKIARKAVIFDCRLKIITKSVLADKETNELLS